MKLFLSACVAGSLLLSVACGSSQLLPQKTTPGSQLVASQPANSTAVHWKIYKISALGDYPLDITEGPDGALWFTNYPDKIGRITPTGQITEYLTPTADSLPSRITLGPDHNLWFTEQTSSQIGRITPQGVITEIVTLSGLAGGITSGPDRSIWFTEPQGNKIARRSESGAITEFPVPTPMSGLGDITLGSDGALWFTETNAAKVGKITEDGAITEYAMTSHSQPDVISAGGDGALWFTEDVYPFVWRMTTSGALSDFRASADFIADIEPGRNNSIWYTVPNTGKIGRITHNVTEFGPPANCGLPVAPYGIAVDHNGNVWFTDVLNGQIGEVTGL